VRTAAGGGAAAPAVPRFQMVGAAGLVCDGDACVVPAQPVEVTAGASAGAPDGARRVAADG
jgi:hypothetical protein